MGRGYWRNRRGELFHSSDLGGTYRVNDGNPENADDEVEDEDVDPGPEPGELDLE